MNKRVSCMIYDHMSPTKIRGEAFERHLIWVQQHPVKVIRHLFGTTPVEAGRWLASATLQGISHRSDEGTVVLLREDSQMFDYQPSQIAIRDLGLTDYEFLSSGDFSELAELYTSGFGNYDRMVELVRVIERVAPRLRFIPRHLHHLLGKDGGSFKFLPRAFLSEQRRVLREKEALIFCGLGHQLSHSMLRAKGIDPDDLIHLSTGWYAGSFSDAILLKMHVPQTEYYALQE